MPLEIINPEQLGAPKGYSNGILTPAGARQLFVSGQVAWDRDQKVVGDSFAEQFDRALGNVIAVVEKAGGAPDHIARLTIYVLDRKEYLEGIKAVGDAYRRRMGKHFPAMTLVEVRGLLEAGAKLELEATAAIP
ncbi:MAG: RidA family protein [Planctomycetota bacterium]|nr:RidA family protein [Planctomycetota bacterium]